MLRRIAFAFAVSSATLVVMPACFDPGPVRNGDNDDNDSDPPRGDDENPGDDNNPPGGDDDNPPGGDDNDPPGGGDDDPPGGDDDPPGGDDDPPGGDTSVRVLSFTANPAIVAFLGESTLSWSTERATSCAIAPGVGAVQPSGSVVVASGEPGTTTTYTLTCQGEGGPASATASVETRLVTRTGDVVVQSQADLTSLAGTNVLTGSLTLTNASGVTDLSPLAGLVQVGGALAIGANPSLANLTLPSLVSVGDDLIVDNNPALTTLSLPALARVEDRVYISRNFQLPPAQVSGLVAQVQGRQGIGGAVVTYENDPAEVLANLEQGFWCRMADGSGFNLALADGIAEVYPPEGFPIAGSYTTTGSQLTLNVPGYPPQTTTLIEIELDHVVAFTTPLLELCHTVSTGLEEGFATMAAYECPSIGYIPDVGFTQNRFWLYPHGEAEWLRTEVFTGNLNDETSYRQFGAYVLDGDRVYLAFGANFDHIRYLSGTLSPDGSQLLIDELEPERGPCTRE